MLLLLTFLFIRSFILSKKNIPSRLFVEALKNENSGHFEEAMITYESALGEVKKTWFHSNLKNKIINKLKVLNTAIEYKNNLHFVRQ